MPGLSLRRVFGLSSIYGVTPVLDKVLSLAFLPIFTHYLTPNAYGSLILLYAFSGIIQLVMSMGLSDSLQKMYWDYDAGQRKEFLGTIWTFNAVINGALLLVLLLFARPVAQFIVQNDRTTILLVLALLNIGITTQAIIPYVFFRAEEKKAKILSVNLISILSRTGFTALFLLVFKLDLLGIFLADLCASSATMLVYLPAMRTLIAPTYKGRYIRDLFKLAPYQFIVSLLAWVISLSDRILLQKLLKIPAEVGVYSVGYTFGSAIVFLINPVLAAWRPYAYRLNTFDPKTYAAQMGQFFTYFIAICAGSVLLIYAFAPEAIAMLTPASYNRAAAVVPIILAAQVCATVSNYFLPTFFIHHKMKLVVIAYSISAAADLVFNISFIPTLGILGAAWSILISYVIMGGLLFLFSHRIQPLPLRTGWIALITISTAGMAFFISRVQTHHPVTSAAFKGALVIPFLIIPAIMLYRRRKLQQQRG